MWEHRRTQISRAVGKPQAAIMRKCGDPSVEFKQKVAQLKQRGCVFNPLKQDGRRYEASWRCPSPDGSILAMAFNLYLHLALLIEACFLILNSSKAAAIFPREPRRILCTGH